MDIHQLRTFVAVAREGSITRASESLHLSQPAVSAHVKAIEDAVGLTLFERTAKGMALTPDGQRLLARAEQTLAAHRELMDEATRIKGRLAGKLRLGANASAPPELVGRLVDALATRHPDLDVSLQHATSGDIVTGLRGGTLDAGFYNEVEEPEADLATVEVSTFGVLLVARPGVVETSAPLDWKALAERPWIVPAAGACCTVTAERLFKAHGIRPRRIVTVDREGVTRALIAQGTGVGLLHSDTAHAAQGRGEVEILHDTNARVRVLFAHLASRGEDPLLVAVASALRERG